MRFGHRRFCWWALGLGDQRSSADGAALVAGQPGIDALLDWKKGAGYDEQACEKGQINGAECFKPEADDWGILQLI